MRSTSETEVYSGRTARANLGSEVDLLKGLLQPIVSRWKRVPTGALANTVSHVLTWSASQHEYHIGKVAEDRNRN